MVTIDKKVQAYRARLERRAADADVYREATDRAMAVATAADLARAIGCSLPMFRQSRLPASARNHRNPPSGWRAGVVKLLRARVKADHRLLQRLLANQARP